MFQPMWPTSQWPYLSLIWPWPPHWVTLAQPCSWTSRRSSAETWVLEATGGQHPVISPPANNFLHISNIPQKWPPVFQMSGRSFLSHQVTWDVAAVLNYCPLTKYRVLWCWSAPYISCLTKPGVKRRQSHVILLSPEPDRICAHRRKLGIKTRRNREIFKM